MSGNGEQIDLNSDVDLENREIEAHGTNLPHPITGSSNELSNAEGCSRELAEDEANDVRETNSSREGRCRSDKDEADRKLGYEAVDVECLEGRSTGTDEGAEMDAAARVGEESSIAINALSEVEMECSERRQISEKVEVMGRDEIISDDTEVVNAAGTINASPSDALFYCEGERQVDGSFASLKEFSEGGVADATSGHYSMISSVERNVKSQEEGVCRMKDEEKVAQNEELVFGSVDVKCDQVVKEDRESHRLIDHDGCVDVLININPEGLFRQKDVDNSGSLHDNLGSDSRKSAEDKIQLPDNLSQKAENLTESKELPPVLATDIRAIPIPGWSENQVGGGQTRENLASDCHILKTETLINIDEANLFDVVVEVDPHAIMDEDDVSDYNSADSADSVVEFNVSDLVWSKVPSHPWWPGQICDPSASSKKAMKYFKTGRYLIAFFGDHTFAWKEAVMIKPFQEYFSELQKQNNLENFHQAIDCALEEFSRRVEFSLACSCLSEELYSKLQTQTLTNAGIRKKLSKRIGGDSSLTTSSFDPLKLINIVKEVAMSPSGETGKLELVRAQAQLLAFNRWKGYYELPKFNKYNVEFNDTDQVLVVENESMEDIAIDIKHDEAAALYGKGNLRTQDISSGKRKHNFEDIIESSEKGKNLSDLMSKKPRRRSLNKKNGSEENAGNEFNLHASSTKYEGVNAICNDPAINNPITHVESGKTKPTFRVGDRIRKVAYKLNESNPILKHDDGMSQKAVAKTRRYRKRSKETLELVSDGKTGNKSTKTRRRRKVSAPIEASDSEFIKDTYWTDRLIQGIAEDQSSFENQNETVECHVPTPSESVIPNAVEQDGVLFPGVISTNQEPHERVEPESETCVEDPYPTALILTFTDLDSVPSETNLIDIFSKYGPLYESKTEVMKKSRSAKVVFKRTLDAETAFSSTGKCSIFGPALVSYRLKFLPPTKVPSRLTKRCRKEAKS